LREVGRDIRRHAREQNRVHDSAESRIQRVERGSIPALSRDDEGSMVAGESIRLGLYQGTPWIYRRPAGESVNATAATGGTRVMAPSIGRS
jgi:hypothetical protein